MKIKSMTASFGKLDNETLDLKEGLNIIQAPNEAGKSTWSAFIRAMLFGINSAERDKGGYLSDKSKFRPWNGKNMEGKMDLRYKGHNITIQRTSIGQTSPMKKFDASYTEVLLPVEELSADNAGEKLTGVSDIVFDRTAFIRQSGIAVSGDPGLEKRIASLISTGDEQTSFSEAEARLKARQNKLRYNKTGIIPKLEAEKADEEEKLSRMDKIADELASIRQEKEKYNERASQLSDDLETYRKLEKSEIAIRIVSAKKRAQLAGQTVKDLRNALTKNGLLINTDDVTEIGKLYASYLSLENAAHHSQEKAAKAKSAYEETQSDMDNAVFKGLSEAEAMNKLTLVGNISDNSISKSNKVSSSMFKALLSFMILAFAGGAALVFMSMYMYAAIATALGVCFLIPVIVLLTGKKSASSQLNYALAEYNFATMDEFRRKFGDYSALCRVSARLSIEADAAEEEREHNCREAEEAKAKLLERVHEFYPEINDPEEIGPALSSLAEPMKSLPQVELEQAKALAEISAITSSVSGDIPDEPVEYIPVPDRSKEDTQKAYVRTAEHISELSDKDAMLRGEINALGDPIETIAQIDKLQELIDLQKHEYDTLSIAIETLNEAHIDLQTKFSPLVNETAGKIMRQLTNGRYEKLVFDKDFNALARAEGETVSHEVLALSEGTSDQVYLSLRLAMVELILSSEEPCPIILDDVFASFDDIRSKSALEYLMGLSSERQIILFTCHSRESALVGDKPGVNVIKL